LEGDFIVPIAKITIFVKNVTFILDISMKWKQCLTKDRNKQKILAEVLWEEVNL